MEKRILYKQTDGTLCVIIPAPKCLATGKTVEQIAAKDVPSGLAYKIVDVDQVPTDRTFRDAWTIADSELTDGTGAEQDVFEDDPTHPDYIAPASDEIEDTPENRAEWEAFVATLEAEPEQEEEEEQ